MIDKDKIVTAIQNEQIRITDHAYEEAVADNLTFKEILISVVHGTIIEQYPKDKPFSSCLIFGENV